MSTVQQSLSFTEVYHAVTQWLSHIEATPESLSEPADGIVEMRAQDLVARIKYTKRPVGQGAVLSLLRTDAGSGSDRLLFAVTSYTDGAIALANSHVVALYLVDSDGLITPQTSEAHALMPRRPVPPPFSPQGRRETSRNELEAPNWTEDTTEWLTCPHCGAAHHPHATECGRCNVALLDKAEPTSAKAPQPNSVAGNGRPGTKSREQASDASMIRPVPTAEPGRPHLQCRTCGSSDIELVDPID
jgi:ribosomal protein L40E